MKTSPHGGTYRHPATVYRGAPGHRARANKLFAQRPHGAWATRACPSCRFTVPVRLSDDALVNHRIGPSQREAWPCKGET